VRLGRGLSKDEVERFAREDARVKGHLDVIRRKELLELVLEKMEGVRDLESRRVKKDKGRVVGKGEKKGWGIF